VEDEA
jgi:dynein heavy chain